MARSAEKRNVNKKLPPFVPLPLDMLESHAYQELPHSAAKALVFFLYKPIKAHIYFRDPKFYAWQFEFTYAEAGQWGFAKATWNRCLRDLLSHGFIDLVSKGDLKSRGRSSSRFVLSQRWRNYGTLQFDKGDWQRSFPERYDPKPKDRHTGDGRDNTAGPSRP